MTYRGRVHGQWTGGCSPCRAGVESHDVHFRRDGYVFFHALTVRDWFRPTMSERIGSVRIQNRILWGGCPDSLPHAGIRLRNLRLYKSFIISRCLLVSLGSDCDCSDSFHCQPHLPRYIVRVNNPGLQSGVVYFAFP